MNGPPSGDDDLRRRLQELGRREAAAAPRLERVLRGRLAASEERPAVESGRTSWWRPATLLAAAGLAAAIAWWGPARPVEDARRVTGVGSPSPAVSTEVRFASSTDGWGLPTDGLLIETPYEGKQREVHRLSREIEELLKP